MNILKRIIDIFDLDLTFQRSYEMKQSARKLEIFILQKEINEMRERRGKRLIDWNNPPVKIKPRIVTC